MIKENIAAVKQSIVAACARSNRGPEEITIVTVTKGRPAVEIKEVIEAGIADIGENRVQEAVLKYNQLTKQRNNESTSQRINWHLVGHLQTNKAKEAVKVFDLIHSVDSLRLAREINSQAVRINKIQDILLEIKTSPEETKYGFNPDEGIEAVKEISRLQNIRIKGLMTIAPVVDSQEQARPYFRILRELKDSIGDLRILSMGMSDDFAVAIEEGATMIRIGRAIFEKHV